MAVRITAVITTIPPRAEVLERALASVRAQTFAPQQTIVQLDETGVGAMANRNAALAKVRTEWVAFLDDDDEWFPNHLEELARSVRRNPGADLFYSWYDGPQGILAVPVQGRLYQPLGVEFGPEQRDHIILKANFIPVTVLARTERLRKVGGFQPFPGNEPHNPCEDWGCWRALLLDGAQFVHVPKVTWRWSHWGGNTSGQPTWLESARRDGMVSQ
jgi:hypothetical protein